MSAVAPSAGRAPTPGVPGVAVASSSGPPVVLFVVVPSIEAASPSIVAVDVTVDVGVSVDRGSVVVAGAASLTSTDAGWEGSLPAPSAPNRRIYDRDAGRA